MQNADVDWMSSPSIFVDDFHAVSRPAAPHLARKLYSRLLVGIKASRMGIGTSGATVRRSAG